MEGQYYGVAPQDRADVEYRYSYTATGGQTSFPAIYTVGSLDVYVNGSKLVPADFTATDSLTVVLNTACVSGDEVQIIAKKLTPVVGAVSPTDLSNAVAVKKNLNSLAVVASDPTTSDIWSGSPSHVSLTGVSNISALPNAAYAGQSVVLYPTAGTIFTCSASLVLQGHSVGASYTASANDEVTVTAITTSQFLVTIKSRVVSAPILGTDAARAYDTVGRNVVVNGGCEVSQVLGTTATSAANGAYAIDNVAIGNNLTAGAWSTTQQTVKVGNLSHLLSLGSTSGLIATVTTSNPTPAATDIARLEWRIEDVNMARFQWGTANGKAAALQFKAYTNIAGTNTYSGYIHFFGSTSYFYMFTFQLTGGVDTQVTIPNIPALTSASTLGSGLACSVGVNLCVGSSLAQTPNVWGTSGFGVSGSTNVLSSTSNIFLLSDVSLEVSQTNSATVAFCTQYERKLYDQVLRECQRYLPVLRFTAANEMICGGFVNTSVEVRAYIKLPVSTRVPVNGIAQSVASLFSVMWPSNLGGTIGTVASVTYTGTEHIGLHLTVSGAPVGYACYFSSSQAGYLAFTGAQI
jgi:uncharacterized membrane protein